MRRRLVYVLAVGALAAAGIVQTAEAKKNSDPVFAEGGVLAGSTNGMSFAPDGTLWVANVLGGTITQIDPESGAILDRLTNADLVFFPDDVVVGADGSIYWTEIALGTVFKRPPDGPTYPLVGFPFGLNSANPLTLSDDGTRLFAAGCYGGPPGNSFVEIDPDLDGDFVSAGIVNVLFGPVPECASNSMSWGDGWLYSPQPFHDEVWRVDPDTGATTPVTTGWPVPIGTAVDSNGELYALAQGVGEVVHIDVDDPDTANNRTVIAEIPFAWADNIAISDDDRIFISSASDSVVAEVMPDGSLRIVVPGQVQLAMSVAVIGNTVYTTHISGIAGWDRNTRAQTGHFRVPFGVTAFPPATSAVAWGENLVLMSGLSGQIMVWDPVANVPLAANQLFPPPTDAQPFDGGLLVTQGNGDIVRLTDTLDVVGVVANVPGALGIAARGGDVFVTDHDDGAVVQIVDGGVPMAVPVMVMDGFAGPEGIDVKGKTMYVVEGLAESLTSIDLTKGTRTTVASGLGFQPPSLLGPAGWFNDVTAAGHHVYVNADRSNRIYEF